MAKNNPLTIALLIISAIIALAIIAWPIYFFGFSTIRIIEMELSSLVFFGAVEAVLVIVLVVFWLAYRKLFK